MHIQQDAISILDITSEFLGIPKEKIFGRTRIKEFVTARHICVFLLRTNTTMTFNEIAKFMQGRKRSPAHHTTMLHSMQVVANLMETDKEMEKDISALQSMLDCFRIRLIDDIRQRREAFLENKVRRSVNRIVRVKLEDKPKIHREATLSEYEKTLSKYL